MLIQFFTVNFKKFAFTSFMFIYGVSQNIISFNVPSEGSFKKDLNMSISFMGNMSVPLIIDFDDGNFFYYQPTYNGLKNLTITKNYTSFGQFRIKANLSNEIVTKNLVIDLISSLPNLTSSIYFEFNCPGTVELNEYFYCNLTLYQVNYGLTFSSFKVDFGDGSDNKSYGLYGYGVPQSIPYPEISTLLVNNKGLLILNGQIFGTNYITHIEIYANNDGFIQLMYLNLTDCARNPNPLYSCGSFLSNTKYFEYLEYTTNITLPTFRVTKGYNNITNQQFGNIIVTSSLMPVIYSNNSDDLLSIPVDISDLSNYRDYTFTQLDTANKILKSVKAIYNNKKCLRYYIRVYYNKLTNSAQIRYSFSTRNKFQVLIYGIMGSILSKTSLIIKVNGTVEILSFNCDSNGKINQEFQFKISYNGNKTIPLMLDYDDGLVEYFTIKDGQNYLNITKNYTTFGQFNIKANLANDIATCQVYINDLSGITKLTSSAYLDLKCPTNTFINEKIYCNVSIQPYNFISSFYSFMVDYGDGSPNVSFQLYAYGIPATVDNPEWSTLLINGKGVLLLNNQPPDENNNIEGIEFQSNSNGQIKILFLNITQCANRTKSCSNYLTQNVSYDYLDITSYFELPIMTVSNGYNYVGKDNIGLINVSKNHVPVIICNDISIPVNLPIDTKSITNTSDLTFSSLDLTTKKLSSIKKISPNNNWRYFVNIIYNRNISGSIQIQKNYTTPGSFNLIIYPINNAFSQINQTILVNQYSTTSSTNTTTTKTTIETSSSSTSVTSTDTSTPTIDSTTPTDTITITNYSLITSLFFLTSAYSTTTSTTSVTVEMTTTTIGISIISSTAISTKSSSTNIATTDDTSKLSSLKMETFAETTNKPTSNSITSLTSRSYSTNLVEITTATTFSKAFLTSDSLLIDLILNIKGNNLTLSPNTTQVINLYTIDATIMNDIMSLNFDINDCLQNCSNQGQCKLGSSDRLICSCFEGYGGSSCSSITNPCVSNNQCLNNSTCIYTPNATSLYECKCDDNKYYGTNCELKHDLCSNMTCSNHGICKIDEAEYKPFCSCFKYYSGVDCETQSVELKAIKTINSITLVISIVFIIGIYLVFILNDALNYFLCMKIKLKLEKKEINQ